jgi:hypothetical protein
LEKIRKLYKTGYIYPLTERDEQGTKIVFVQLKKIDPEQFTSADAIRLSSIISAALLEEEETQIAGFTTVIDYEGATMKQISLFSVSDIVDLINCCANAVGRYKKVCLVNLPSFASFLFDVARSTLNDKMKQRILQAKDMEDLKNYIAPELLPQEHGGLLPEAVHMANFDKFFESIFPQLDEIKSTLVIDWNNVSDEKEKIKETIGSFRKLELD